MGPLTGSYVPHASLCDGNSAVQPIRYSGRQGYYSGARTDIINSHAELRAALDLLIKAAEHEHAAAGYLVTRDPDRATR